MAVQMDFWADAEIERLEKKVATLSAELQTLREQNRLLFLKRFGKRTLCAMAKTESLPPQLPPHSGHTLYGATAYRLTGKSR
jgi:hypothetical protein